MRTFSFAASPNLLLLGLSLSLGACGSGTTPAGLGGALSATPSTSSSSTPSGPAAPSVPAGLTATGTLTTITLNWSASTGGNLTGYEVYRKTDSTAFSKIATTASATYTDTNSSGSARHGIVYSYQVKAVGELTSEASSTVRSLYGTRLNATYADGFETTGLTALSPFVAEGSIVINRATLGDHLGIQIIAGTTLYVADGAVIDIEKTHGIWVNGTLQVLATSSTPARITSHSNSGPLAAGQGITLSYFTGCTDYDSGTGQGNLIQNITIENLASGIGISVDSCSPKISNSKISTTSASGSQLRWPGSVHPSITHNSFDGFVPVFFITSYAGSGFALTHNRFTNQGSNALRFENYAVVPISSGQVTQNSFDGMEINLYAYNTDQSATPPAVPGASPGSIPLDANHWHPPAGVTPTITRNDITPSAGADSTLVDFGTPLGAAPVGIGPDW